MNDFVCVFSEKEPKAQEYFAEACGFGEVEILGDIPKAMQQPRIVPSRSAP